MKSDIINKLSKTAGELINLGEMKAVHSINNLIDKLNNNWEDKMLGGLADNNTPCDFNKEELRIGIKHELEHTKDIDIAAEIAMDHLKEDPKYYSNMQKNHQYISPTPEDIFDLPNTKKDVPEILKQNLDYCPSCEDK